MKLTPDLPRARPTSTSTSTSSPVVSSPTVTSTQPSTPTLSGRPADRFTEQVRSIPPVLSSFSAVDGGRGVGGTLSLLRPVATAVGVATFTPMSALAALAASGATAPKGTLILDTNLGELEKTAHPSWQAATLDHHGPVHGADKGRGTNSTTQLLDRFADAARADVAAARANPRFTAALVAVEKVAKQSAPTATTAQKEQAAAGVLALGLTSISSDNVGDGLGWPVWMAKNQCRVLLDMAGDNMLHDTIRAATIHEDFGVFGGNYLRGVDDVTKLPAAIKLQSALFLSYDEALARAGVRGSDRVPAEKAEAVAADVGAAIDALLKDPALVEGRSSAFFTQVGLALTTIQEHSLIKDASIADNNGGYALPVFDTSKLPKELGTFAGWAVPPLFGQHTLQMTVSPGSDGRSTMILAIPDERTLPSGKGLLGLLPALNALEQQQSPPGSTPSSWFGRDTVLLPTQPGSVLTPADVRAVVEAAGLLTA